MGIRLIAKLGRRYSFHELLTDIDFALEKVKNKEMKEGNLLSFLPSNLILPNNHIYKPLPLLIMIGPKTLR